VSIFTDKNLTGFFDISISNMATLRDCSYCYKNKLCLRWAFSEVDADYICEDCWIAIHKPKFVLTTNEVKGKLKTTHRCAPGPPKNPTDPTHPT